MKLKHYSEIPLEEVEMDGAKGASIRWLISQKDGAPNFATRMFEVEPGGFTPYHTHSWEHENFIVSGEGALVTEEGDKPFKEGDVIYVPPQFKHCYKNTGDTTLKFLCMIPNPESVKIARKKVNPFAKGVANNC
ncbi:MAG: cupin domain-containing protein [Candidatus Stygibacter australis]|nr:cupin domain-containing protein [Candidatus Stygibacter australis]MDP8323049.1 cupin domain-containing protein [Candidatus Stygibacter australis]